MSDQAIVISVSVVYLVICLAIGSWPRKKSSKGATGYVAGDRSMGLVLMYFITGATIFSSFAFLGMPGWAYSKGVAALYVLAFGCLGFMPFYFLGPRAARVGKANGYVTQAEMVAARFNSPGLAIVMALVSLIAFVPYLALQMKGSGYVLQEMTSGAISESLGGALVYGVVLAYVMRSGVLGVGWTNTFQGIFMMLLAWGLGLYIPYTLYGGVGKMFEAIAASERAELLVAPGLMGGKPWSWSEYSSLILVSIAGFSMWPHLFMKAFTAKDENTLRRTVVLYPTFQIFLVPILLIGFAGVLFKSAPETADQILPHMLMNLDLPPLLVGLFCAGALAASMSSGDTILHAAASIIVRDGIATGMKLQLDPERETKWIRAALIPVILAAYILFLVKGQDIVSLLAFAYGPVTQLAPAVVACLYSRKATGTAVLAGLVLGVGVNLTFVACPEWRPFAIHAGIYGLAVNVGLIVLLSALRVGASADDSDDFMAIAEGSARAED